MFVKHMIKQRIPGIRGPAEYHMNNASLRQYIWICIIVFNIWPALIFIMNTIYLLHITCIILM